MKAGNKERIFHIAQFGTYDLQSLGDTMFPVVFKGEMEKRLGKDNVIIDLYSPFGTEHPYNNLPLVHSVKELREEHAKRPYDCLVLGGGEFVHFLQVEYISVDELKQQYQPGELWRKPQAEAQELGIPVFWNCVGVSRDFENEEEINIIRDSCKELGYLSVRDKYSKIRLEKMAGVQNVHEVADMLWLFNRHFSAEKLADQKKQLETEYPFLQKDYLVLQYGTSADLDKLGEIVNKIGERYNLEIVLLTINYCHEDEDIVKKLKEKFSNFRMIDKKLQPVEIMSVISGGKYFLGTSLHGNITAMSYGVKNLCLDMYPSFVSKMDGLFEMLNCKELLVNGLEGLHARFEHLAETDIKGKLDKEIEQIQKRLDSHFDRMARLIQNGEYERYECEAVPESKIFLHKGMLSSNGETVTDICCGINENVEFCFELPNFGKEIEGVIYEKHPFLIESMRIECDKQDINCYFLNSEEENEALFENRCIYKGTAGKRMEKGRRIKVNAKLVTGESVEIRFLKSRLKKLEQINYDLEVGNKRLKGHVDYMINLEREYKQEIDYYKKIPGASLMVRAFRSADEIFQRKG